MSPEELVSFARGCRHASRRVELRSRPPAPPALLPADPGCVAYEPQIQRPPASRFRITSFVFIWRFVCVAV